MSLLKVQGASGLAKDPSSGAVVNVDDAAYRAARLRKEKQRMEKELLKRVADLESRVDALEKRLTERL